MEGARSTAFTSMLIETIMAGGRGGGKDIPATTGALTRLMKWLAGIAIDGIGCYYCISKIRMTQVMQFVMNEDSVLKLARQYDEVQLPSSIRFRTQTEWQREKVISS